MKKRFGVILGLLMISWGLHAQDVFRVSDAITERNFMPHEIPYFLNTNNTLSFRHISSRGFSNRFQSNSAYQNKDFKPGASYWILLPIRHSKDTKKVWLLEFYDQTIDRIEAYVPQEDGSYQ